MSIHTFILVKKLMIAVTILDMDEESYLRKIFKIRSGDFDRNIELGVENKLRSPTFKVSTRKSLEN